MASPAFFVFKISPTLCKNNKTGKTCISAFKPTYNETNIVISIDVPVTAKFSKAYAFMIRDFIYL